MDNKTNYFPDIYLMPLPDNIKIYSVNGGPFPHPALTEWLKKTCQLDEWSL